MKTKSIIILIVVMILVAVGIFLLGQSLSKPKDNSGDQSPETTPPETSSPQTYDIEIRNYLFFPSSLTIKVGDTVVWTNAASIHTVISDSGSEISSESLNEGETYSHTFNTAGIFAYHCSIHPSMKATIIVE